MKKHPHIILLFVLSFFIFYKCKAQGLYAIHQVKNDSIELRWVCTNDSLFRIAIKNGFFIKRMEWDNIQAPSENDFSTNSKILVDNIQPLAKENKKWDSIINIIPAAELLYSYLYKVQTIHKYNDMAMGLCMLSCDIYRDCAIGAGLFFHDTEIDATKKYAYMIGVNYPTLHKIKPYIFLANPGSVNTYKTISDIKARYKRNTAFLEWNYKELNHLYAAYIIERSENNTDFIRINKEPCIGVTTQYEPDKKTITYSDTITTTGITYYYRIRGINRFGETCDPSTSAKLTAYPDLEGELKVDTILSRDKKQTTLHWHFENKTNERWIKGFEIYRADQIAGMYTKLNEKTLSPTQNEYMAENIGSVSYYRVDAIGMNNDTLQSFPKLILIPDNTPACIPIYLNGTIDKNGRTTIHWSPCRDHDLQGYKVYRANSDKEEFVELTKKLSTDTIFNDSISINTLTPHIYYAVASVDQVFNTSSMSTPVKLKRPDNIVPVQPIIRELKMENEKLKIKWINSSSEDVKQHVLMRSANNNSFENILSINENDTTSIYTDTNLINNTMYVYKIVCFDDSQNKTESQTRSTLYKQLVKKPVNNIKADADRINKNIALSWAYPEKDIWKYTIYRNKKGEPMQILKTISSNDTQFIDKNISISNTYIYHIKAIFNNGTESKMSEGIEVVY